MSNNLALPQLATAQQEKEATINDQSGKLRNTHSAARNGIRRRHAARFGCADEVG
jgi:hypothetical protein